MAGLLDYFTGGYGGPGLLGDYGSVRDTPFPSQIPPTFGSPVAPGLAAPNPQSFGVFGYGQPGGMGGMQVTDQPQMPNAPTAPMQQQPDYGPDAGYGGAPQGGGMPQGGGGFMSRVEQALMSPVVQFGLGLASGSTPQQGFGNALGALQARQRLDQAGFTTSIKEWLFARENGYAGTYEQWKKEDPASKEKFALNPLITYDDNGNPTGYVQPGDRGGARRQELGQGESFGRGVYTENTGTELITRDRLTGQERSRRPLNNEEKAAATEEGKKVGDVRFNLPQAKADAANVDQSINDLKNHPGRKYALGPWSLVPAVPGSKQADFITRFNQVKDQAFLQGFAILKGGGSITEKEGEKATAAKNRANRATSEADFDAAMADFQKSVHRGIEVMQEQAKGSKGRQSPANNDPYGLR